MLEDTEEKTMYDKHLLNITDKIIGVTEGYPYHSRYLVDFGNNIQINLPTALIKSVSWNELKINYKNSEDIYMIILFGSIMFDKYKSYGNRLTKILYEMSLFKFEGDIYVMDYICDTTRDWIRNMPTIINLLVQDLEVFEDISMFKLKFTKSKKTDSIMSTLFSDKL